MAETTPSRIPWISLLFCIGVSLFAVGYPMYVIRPFRTQGASELSLALIVAQYRTLATMACACVGVVAALLYWRSRAQSGKSFPWWRGMAVLGASLVIGLAVAARINVFELMFHPVDRPAFALASQVKLDGDEKVLAVKLGEQARAYPVRSMAYHHLLNDTVDAKAIIATY
jgi:amino acid transporter